MPEFKVTTGNHRLQVVSNFGDGDCGAGKVHTHTCVYFTHPTMAITKIRDYSQSRKPLLISGTCCDHFVLLIFLQNNQKANPIWSSYGSIALTSSLSFSIVALVVRK